MQYRINFAMQTAVGTYTMTIGPNIANTSGALMNQNGNATPGEPADSLVNIFTITAPRVASVTPTGVTVALSAPSGVTYNKPMNSDSFDVNDIASFTGPGGANGCR